MAWLLSAGGGDRLVAMSWEGGHWWSTTSVSSRISLWCRLDIKIINLIVSELLASAVLVGCARGAANVTEGERRSRWRFYRLGRARAAAPLSFALVKPPSPISDARAVFEEDGRRIPGIRSSRRRRRLQNARSFRSVSPARVLTHCDSVYFYTGVERARTHTHTRLGAQKAKGWHRATVASSRKYLFPGIRGGALAELAKSRRRLSRRPAPDKSHRFINTNGPPPWLSARNCVRAWRWRAPDTATIHLEHRQECKATNYSDEL